MLGMWYELERIYRLCGARIGSIISCLYAHACLWKLHTDRSTSFFVGDAAGRAKDFAGTDRKWALNADLTFLTPEVITVMSQISVVSTYLSGILPRETSRTIQTYRISRFVLTYRYARTVDLWQACIWVDLVIWLI